jgi:hypothetical protein
MGRVQLREMKLKAEQHMKTKYLALSVAALSCLAATSTYAGSAWSFALRVFGPGVSVHVGVPAPHVHVCRPGGLRASGASRLRGSRAVWSSCLRPHVWRRFTFGPPRSALRSWFYHGHHRHYRRHGW